MFAGMRVSDRDAAERWCERLLGAEAAFHPNETEAVFELGAERWLYVIEVADNPGGGLLTMLVDDLDDRVAAIGSRGIEPDEVENYPNDVRKVIYRDPDGNEIGFGTLVSEG